MPLHCVPTGNLLGTALPRAGHLLFEAQGDLLLLVVDVQDLHFDLLVDGDHLGGMVDAAPAHVGDVQQAVDAAQIDERAEVGDVLDHALAALADFQLGQELGLLLCPLLFDQRRRLTTMFRRISSIFSTSDWIVRLI